MNADKEKLLNDSERIFTDYLLRTSRRRTPERFMVLKCACQCQGHFTAEELCMNLSETGSRVATATVYSTLQLLSECGLVLMHRFGDGPARYEFSPGPHLHLVCNSCGKIKEVHDADLEILLLQRKYRAFSPASFSLSVFGLCSACARKNRKISKAKLQTKHINTPSKKQ